MSYKRGNILSTWKQWEQVAFVMKNKMLVGILERSLHTLIVNTTFRTKIREVSGRTISCCQYHKSNEWTDNDFEDKNLHSDADELSENYKPRSSYYNDRYNNRKGNRYNQRRNNEWKSKYDGDFYRSPQRSWYGQNRRNTEWQSKNYDFGNSNSYYKNRTFEDRISIPNIEVNWDSEYLSPIRKDCYEPHPDAVNRDLTEVEAYRNRNEMMIAGDSVPNPILRFEEANLPSSILEIFKSTGFNEPTPIQAQSWPIVMSGKNLIGIAQTGSGKTLGYMVPGILHIKKQVYENKKKGPVVVILAPTRELVQQINRVAFHFGNQEDIMSVSVYGGQAAYHQLKTIAMDPEICVATPGRLFDFITNEQINVKQCSYLVIDEADRMLDMGFEPQIRQILQQIRPDRQIVMWSASWPKKVVSLAKTYIADPVQITIGSPDGGANKDITQIVDVCTENEKITKLENLLAKIYERGENDVKILIFVNTKQMVAMVANSIKDNGYDVLLLHGDKSQRHRDVITNVFRKSRNKILVATDVISRGFDSPDIDYVINFDFPRTAEQYIHRIGRTARCGRKGQSYTFFTPVDRPLASALVDILKDADQKINPELLRFARKRF